MLLTSCGGDDDGGAGGKAPKTIKLQKLELGDAKYLSLTGTPTRAQAGETDAEVGLFKIDAQGNVSTVVLWCIESEDGTVTQVRNDIKVIPRYLVSLSGAYTLMLRCDFQTEEGYFFNMLSYYEGPGAGGYFNMLVRNSDGKIFYIPQSVGSKYFEFPEIQSTALDSKGNLYILPYMNNGLSDLLAITQQNDDLVIKQVNPNGLTGIQGDEIWPLDNGTVIVVYPSKDHYTFFYPNGGFEQGPVFDGQALLTKTNDRIKAVKLEVRAGTPQHEYIVSLHDYNIGISAGGNTLSAPIASISSGTGYSTDLGDPNYIDWVSKVRVHWQMWIYPVYETADSYFLGQCLRVDKQTKQIIPLNWEQSDNIIFPTKENTYKGLAWRVTADEAAWFNIETLEHGVVHFDLSSAGNFQRTDYFEDIPSGKVTITGVRYSDGKQVVCIVDIETGQAICSANDSDRPITVLVPLN